MKDIINKLNTSFLEKTALSVFGLLSGLILSELLKDSYIDYFLLILVFILIFLYVYYKSSTHVENISSVLEDLYTSQKGDIQYFDSPKEFYKASSQYVLDAKHEILIYNDYFGHSNPPMGFDTSDQYYINLEKNIEKINTLKFSCIISASKLQGTMLSDRYQENLIKLFNISKQRHNNSDIIPFAYADENKRPLYTSFTIIDNSILRIPMKGIVDNISEKKFRPSKIIGGFVIKDNEDIINHFREKYKNTEQLSIKYQSIDEILEAIKV